MGGPAVSDELTEGVEPEEKSGLSRRNALKAGVAVGVGAVAWSGVSITSLGGTPAYAQAVTGIIIDRTQSPRAMPQHSIEANDCAVRPVASDITS